MTIEWISADIVIVSIRILKQYKLMNSIKKSNKAVYIFQKKVL
jgi:hypothetical protein